MSNKALLIGGPCDGVRVNVPTGLRYMKRMYDVDNSIQTTLYHAVLPNITIPMKMFRHESITDAKAVEMLFDNYIPHTETKA